MCLTRPPYYHLAQKTMSKPGCENLLTTKVSHFKERTGSTRSSQQSGPAILTYLEFLCRAEHIEQLQTLSFFCIRAAPSQIDGQLLGRRERTHEQWMRCRTPLRGARPYHGHLRIRMPRPRLRLLRFRVPILQAKRKCFFPAVSCLE